MVLFDLRILTHSCEPVQPVLHSQSLQHYTGAPCGTGKEQKKPQQFSTHTSKHKCCFS